MRYQHTLGFQLILQRAVRAKKAGGVQEKDRPTRRGRTAYSWQELAEILNMPPLRPNFTVTALRSTLIRFDDADLKAYMIEQGRLYLDSGTANALWDRLKPEISVILASDYKGSGSGLFGHELIGGALSWNYRCEEDHFNSWQDAGFKGRFFGYKPSYRKMGHVVKSAFDIEPVGNEYFWIEERQISTLEVGRGTVRETSTGYGLAKSGRIWMFLKEHMEQQPRVFCFHRRFPSQVVDDRDEKTTITHLFGWVLESDTNFTNGLYPFKIGLASEATDKANWDEMPEASKVSVTYNTEKQIDSIPITSVAKSRYTTEEIDRIKSIVIDMTVIEWISSEIGDDPNPQWAHF